MYMYKKKTLDFLKLKTVSTGELYMDAIIHKFVVWG